MQDNRNYGKLGAHLIFEVLGGMWVCGDCVCVRGGGGLLERCGNWRIRESKFPRNIIFASLCSCVLRALVDPSFLRIGLFRDRKNEASLI